MKNLRIQRTALALFFLIWMSGCGKTSEITLTPQAALPDETATPLPQPTTAALPEASPTLEVFSPTPEPALRTNGPYFAYFRNVDDINQLVLMDADGGGRQAINLPQGMDNLDMKFVSPDGRWLAFYTGSAGEYGTMPEQGTSDLALNLLDLNTGESQVITRLLSSDYPNNFVEAAKILNDEFKTPESLYDAFLNGITESIAWSSDGRYLAFAGQMDGLSSDLYVYELETKLIRRLSSGDQELQWLGWSPDGKWILQASVFWVGMGMSFDIYAVNVDGSSSRYLSTNAAYGGIENWLDAHTYFENDSQNGPGDYGLRLVDVETGAIKKIWDGSFQGYRVSESGNWLALFAFTSVLPPLNDPADFSPGLQLINLDTLQKIKAPEPLPDPPNTFLQLEAGDVIPLDFSYMLGGEDKISFSPDSNYWVVANSQEIKIYSPDLTLVKEMPSPAQDETLRAIEWRPDSSGLFLIHQASIFSLTISDGSMELIESNLLDIDPYRRLFMWTAGP